MGADKEVEVALKAIHVVGPPALHALETIPVHAVVRQPWIPSLWHFGGVKHRQMVRQAIGHRSDQFSVPDFCVEFTIERQQTTVASHVDARIGAAA